MPLVSQSRWHNWGDPRCSLPGPPSPGIKGQGQKLMEKPSGICQLCLISQHPSPRGCCRKAGILLPALCRFGLGRGVAGLVSTLPVEVFGVQGRVQPEEHGLSPVPALPVLIRGWGLAVSMTHLAAELLKGGEAPCPSFLSIPS